MLTNEPQANRPHDHPKWSTGIVSVAVILFLLWFLRTGVSQLTGASILIAAGAALAFLRPDIAIITTFIYLLFLGDIRRLVSQQAGNASQDPLLLVGPAVAGILFVRLLFERKIRTDTPLSKMVLVLMMFMTLEIFNPAQGGLMVGAAGAMFYMLPLLWFWVGRSLPTEKITRELIQVIFPIVAALGALLGLYQTFFGYLSFEAHWVHEQIANGFSAMIIAGSVVRSFSFFTSPGEYSLFLGIGIACCAAPLIAGRLRLVSLLIPVLLWAMFLASIRSAIVLASLAVLSMVAMMGRNSEQMFSRAFFAVIVGGGLIYFSLHRLEDMESANSRMETLKEHTIDGILNPGESSATGHYQIALLGIAKGLKNPLGEGLGSTTMAAGKLGSRGGVGYENDVADMFASLGVFGGLLYGLIVVYALFLVFTTWRERRTFTSLVVFGILVSQLGFWTMSGHYALIGICWFLIGSMDRASVKAVAEIPHAVPVRSVHAHPAYQP